MNQPVEEYAEHRPLSEEAMTRILMHGMHEETMFYNRINFFMLIEALLFTSLVSANGLVRQNADVARICALVGLLVSLIWGLVQVSKGRRVKAMGERLRRVVPDFSASLALPVKLHGLELPATRILAWVPPTICGLGWLTLLVLRA